MQVAPEKAASADDLAKLAANTPPPPPAPEMAVGPVGPGSSGATSGARVPQMAGGVVRGDGFRQLEGYGSGSPRNRILSVEFGINSVTLTPADQRRLDDAAQLGKDKGTFRVVGRSNEASQKSQQRATAVARQLQNAGISQDRIYVGSDSGAEGAVDVMLDK
jgi:outer membrane protein OmpA-like peptidoglycan-associated protein